MLTKEIIEKFARALRNAQDPAWGNKVVEGVTISVTTDEETGAGYDRPFGVNELEREDIKAIGDWMGETVYLNTLDECGICINPDEDELEIGLWEKIN